MSLLGVGGLSKHLEVPAPTACGRLWLTVIIQIISRKLIRVLESTHQRTALDNVAVPQLRTCSIIRVVSKCRIGAWICEREVLEA